MLYLSNHTFLFLTQQTKKTNNNNKKKTLGKIIDLYNSILIYMCSYLLMELFIGYRAKFYLNVTSNSNELVRVVSSWKRHAFAVIYSLELSHIV